MLRILRSLTVSGFLVAACYTASAQAPEQVTVDGKVYTYVEQMPVFPGGQSALYQAIGQSIVYPTEALQQRLEGRVFVKFVVGTSGAVQGAQIVKSVHPLLDAEAIRAVSSLPAWQPGKQVGRPVAVSFTVPITFRLPADVEQVLAQRAQQPLAAEPQPALFPGGPEALSAFLTAVPYPEAARAKQTTGRVFVQFEISATGKVEKVASLQPTPRTTRQPSASAPALALTTDLVLLKAAEQWVATMPAWQPASQKAAPVTSTQLVYVDFYPAPPSPAVAPVYAYADQMPNFVGNSTTAPFTASLYHAIRYPAEALRGNIQGQVLVYFIVNEEGKVEQADVIQSAHSLLTDEALRVVTNQLAKAPAMHQGKPVKVFYTLPLNFAVR